jgi:hypothetical protein
MDCIIEIDDEERISASFALLVRSKNSFVHGHTNFLIR